MRHGDISEKHSAMMIVISVCSIIVFVVGKHCILSRVKTELLQ